MSNLSNPAKAEPVSSVTNQIQYIRDSGSGKLVILDENYLVKNDLMVISVVPGLSIFERIALGNYDEISPCLTNQTFERHKSMQKESEGRWVADLYHPGYSLSPEETMRDVDFSGWIRATPQHLLTFGQTFPDVQRKFPIISLGLIENIAGFRHFLGLGGSDAHREVFATPWAAGFHRYDRFLRVKKIS